MRGLALRLVMSSSGRLSETLSRSSQYAIEVCVPHYVGVLVQLILGVFR